MEPVRNLTPVGGLGAVQERQGGGRRQADLFRKALQQDGDQEQSAGAETSVRTRLQPQRPSSRNQTNGPGHHIDVLA
ncbi:MAG: hypothetical protein JNK49_19175 [Planctomycetes bacterium]|nr:hypothetical protein [Planctomycetota bacterium]